MNKPELIAKISEKSKLSKKDAELALDSFVDVVTETLVKGEKVQLVGFGTFEVRHRKARTGHSPQDGKPIDIAASDTAGFKVGQSLKDALNGKK